MPTVLGVIRNAFVVGLTEGFSNLPPREAEKKENPVKQAWDALTDDKGPPEAQPDKGQDKGQEKQKPAPRRGRAGKSR